MAIPREYATSNPLVRDELGKIPLPAGTLVGDFVAPEFPVDAETVDTVTTAEHELDLDDLRAPDAEAKSVRFETGGVSTISIVERAKKTTMDASKVEEAGSRGVNLVAERLASIRDDIEHAQEYRTSQLTMAPANHSGTHKASGVNFRTVDLFSTVEAANEVIVNDGYFQARFGIIGKRAWRYARENEGFRKFAAGSNIAAGSRDLTLAAFAEYLGLDEVRLGDFRRKIAGALVQFWPVDSFLVFARQKTLTNRTFAQTAVCPYGKAHADIAGGTAGALVDARTARLSGTDGLLQVGAYKRYRTALLNANLGFLWYGVVGT